ncbi:MAG: DUF1330 domain-containing protein [Desulfuromonas sp.]|nr:MAG: DUF1330 domain-containing protein [Desulfuromonas sp.]
MSIYMIIDSRVKDQDTYQEYIDRVAPIIVTFGGRYHVRGGKIRALGSWNPERIIVLEFPSEERLTECLTSPEYAEIAPLRLAGADAQAIIVEGCE